MSSAATRLTALTHAFLCAAMFISGVVQAGSLTGSVSSSTATTTISTYGTKDWKHFGYASVGSVNRKSGASAYIPDYTSVGSGSVLQTTTGARGISWSSGTPTSSVTGTKNGVAVAGAGNGFQIKLPADAQARTVRVYVGGNNSAASFTAHLSDGSAVDYANSVSLTAGAYARQYTITYTANGPGRTLDLTWTMTSGSGSVHIFAAAAPTITYANHAPTLGIASSYTLQLNQPAFVAANGNDVDGDTITYSATGLPTGVTINSVTGVISGTPTAAGTFSASVKATDTGALTATVPVSFTVVNSSTNHAPSSVSGSFTTAFETPVTITPTFIDTDLGDAWTLVLDTQPTHGTASVSGMQIVYTPANGYVGPDTFNFRVVDKYSAYGTGTVNGNVQAIIPAQVSSVTATPGTVVGAVNLSWPAAESAIDYYVYRGTSAMDPSPVLLGVTAGTAYSDATASAGSQYYYSVKSHNSTAFGTISTSAMGFADTAPTGVSASFAATLETPVAISPNFTDPDAGDTAQFAVVTQPSHGVASVTSNQITYTPAAGYVGPDSFTFSVTDRAGAAAVGTATGAVAALTPQPVTTINATQGTLVGAVQVNWSAATNALSYKLFRGTSASDPSPVLVASVSTTSHTDTTASPGLPYYYSVQSQTIGQSAATSASVLGFADTPPSAVGAAFAATLETPLVVAPSFSDPDAGDTAQFAVVTQPSHGSAGVANNQITYSPAAGYVGADSFTFSVTDRAGAAAVGTATGTVTALAPQPVTSLTATQGTLLGSVQLSWGAANNALSYKVYRGVSAADPFPTPIATVTTTSYADSTAAAGVQYYYSVQSLTIGQSASPSAPVLGFADTAPSAVSATFAATMDTPVAVSPTYSDPDAGDVAQYAIVAQPTHGAASVTSNQILYTPSVGYVGADSFTFSVTDRAGSTATGTATGTVTALTPQPVAVVTATQGTLVGSVQLAWAAAENALSYKVLRGSSPSDPAPMALGTVTTTNFADTTAAAGNLYYYAVQSLTIGQSAVPSASVLGFADTPPSMVSATFAASLETPVAVTANYTDPDAGDTAQFSIVTQPSFGGAVVVGNQITYTPATGYVGPDSFTFAVTDKAGAATIGTAVGTVTAPTPVPVSTVTASQGTLLGSVQLSWSSAVNARSYRVLRGNSISDPSPTPLAVVTNTSYADTTAAPGNPYYYAVQSLTIGQSAAPSATVLGFADTPPSGAAATFAAALETPVQVVPTFLDPDSGDTATFAILSQPLNGSVVLASNKMTYTPNPTFVGSDSFTFSVTDRAGAVATGVAAGVVTAPDPEQVAGVNASQGTLVGGVQLTWSPSANARMYNVLRGNGPADPAPTALSTMSGTSFLDTTAAAGIQYFYSVQAATYGKTAQDSPKALGFADTPPTAASATFETPVGASVVVTPEFVDPDPAETFTYSIVVPPVNGTVTAVGQTLTYTPNGGYAGPDAFTFRVTDKAGASAVGTAAGNVFSMRPDPVPGLTATKATRVNAVDLNWSAALNAATYTVFRSADQNDPSPVQIGTVSGLTFTDSTARPGDRHYYFVRGNNPFQMGSVSSGVLGFADTPPQNPDATFSTLGGQAVLVIPTWVDEDPGETFTLTIVTPPSHGNAEIVNSQIRYTPLPSYTGADAFQFSVTDRAGASTTGWANGVVAPGVPEAPKTLIVSQGTLLGSVKLDWQSMLGAQQYLVARSDTASSSSSVIATIPGNSFSDTNVTPGATYYYRVIGVGASGNSPPSEQVSGYADTAPTTTSASATTLFNTPVAFAPNVTDQDPQDSFTLAIDSVPAYGSVVLSPDQRSFNYTPNTGWSGKDTFNYTAKDQAGAAVSGLATVAVGCPSPTVGALSISQPKLFAGSGFKITTNYGNTGCPAVLTSMLEVLSGTTLVYTSSQANLNGVVSSPIAYAVDSLQAGSYTLRISVTDSTTGNSASQSLPLAVSSYHMPTFTATGTLFSNLDQATIAVGTSPDCQLTSDRAAALADHRLCYYEVAPVPPGLVPVTQSALPTWSGKVSVPATYLPTLSVYQYDDFGAPKILGSIERSMAVLPLQSMSFAAVPPTSVAQYMQEATVTVKQTGGSPCQITTDRAAAIRGTNQGTRMCFLEFATVSPYQTLLATGIRSPFLVAGTSSVNWSVSAFDLAGNQIPFATGTTDVNVVPPDVQFESTVGTTNPIATVTNASVRLNSTGSVGCTLTINAAAASVAGVEKPCLVEWTQIPEGLVQSTTVDVPELDGILKNAGVNPVGFNVSYFDVSGVKRQLWTATSPIVAFPPPLPEVILKAGRLIGTDIYSVPVTGGSVATLFVDTSKWPVDASVRWSDETVERTYRINPQRGTQVIPATAAPLWTRRQAIIRLFLRDSPSLFVEKTIEVVSTPLAAVTLDLDQLSATVPDNARTPLSAHVSMRSPVGPLYDEQTMGQWSVQFGTKDQAGTFWPAGEPILTNSDGVANSGIEPFGLTLVKVQAIATPVSPFADIDLTKLTSPTRMSQVVKGTPVDATISVKGLSEGSAPLVGIFRIQYSTRSDQLANQSVSWFISSDNGMNWTRSDLTGVQVIQRFGEGNYLVKAGLINRNTGVTSETPPVGISVWDVPKIKVTGPQFAFPGTPTSLSVALTQTNGLAVESGTVEWSVSRRVVVVPGQDPPAPLATGTGTKVDFTSQEAGPFMVSLRARMNSSNPDNPKAWGIAQYQVTYGAPERPFNIISAPPRAEVGKPYSFDLSVRTKYDIAATNLKLAGRWTLPDGTVIASLAPVTYTPTEADLALGSYITLKHEVWVVGYEDSTLQTASKSVQIWKYVWPNWRVATSVTTPVAPSTARFMALPDNAALVGTLEGLTYTWTVPSTMRTMSQPGSKLDVVVDYGGSHTVGVVVADARGNSTTLESVISIADAKPYVIDVQVSNQSKWTHAPIQVGVAPKVSGGHPKDSIVEWKYFLNGAPLDLPNKNVVSVALAQAGAYILEARVTSRMGATASKETSITVQENQPAVCTITGASTQNRLMAAIQANCQDPDGAITKYQWAVNGVIQPFATGYKFTYVLPPDTKFPLAVELVVTDDGGFKSTTTAAVN